MKEIPNISFFKRSKAELEFEIIPLKSLFSRRGKLEHSPEKPHRIDFYIIMFITKGKGVHYVDFRPYNFREGSILFISKGQAHAFEIRPDRDGFLIFFTERFLSKNLIHSDILSLHRLYNYHLHPPAIHSEEMGGNNFINIVREIYEEYTFPDDYVKEETLRLLLKLLLLRAERVKHTLIPQSKNPELIIKFLTFKNRVEKSYMKTRNAKDYASVMNMSYKNLNEICKRVIGNTAKEFIDNFVVLEIKRQLATTDISVKELTYQLGFDEPTNFIKYFKKHTRQSPHQFKRTLSK